MFRWSSNIEFHPLLWKPPLDVPAGVTRNRATGEIDHSLLSTSGRRYDDIYGNLRIYVYIYIHNCNIPMYNTYIYIYRFYRHRLGILEVGLQFALDEAAEQSEAASSVETPVRRPSWCDTRQGYS